MGIFSKKSLIFIGFTFLCSWFLAILFYLFGGKWGTPQAFIIATIYMFIPMIMVIVVQKLIYKEPIKEPLGISWRFNQWWLVAWLLPPLIAFATLGVSLLFPGVEFSPEMAGMYERFKEIVSQEELEEMKKKIGEFPIHPFWLTLIQGLIAGITINALTGFGEELGWRGFLQKEFSTMGFWHSSAIIGIIWGIWHAPLILQGHNYPQHPLIGVGMMIGFCLLFAPIFSYIRIKAKSVIAAAILHGSLNGTAGLAIIVVKGGNDLLVGVTGLAGFIVLSIVNLFLFLLTRKLSPEVLSIVSQKDITGTPFVLPKE